jgi:ribosome-binding factor A
MKSFGRLDRVEALIQTDLAELFQQKPELLGGSSLVTITAVKISKDLSFAKIYITLHNEHEQTKILNLLNKNAKTFRYLLAQRVQLRRLPELHFYYDHSIAYGAHINNLLNQIK